MRAVAIETFGDASGMTVVELPEPVAGPGQMLIAVEAVGVGGVDAVIRRGTLGSAAFVSGHIPGSEVAGRVIGVGEEVDRAWLDKRVWAFTGVGGGYAERAVAAVDDVITLPEGLSAIDAVTLGSAGPVAHFALAHARFAAGESVLVRGAAGSIGIMVVQLAAAGLAGAAHGGGTTHPPRADGAARPTIGVTTSSPERGDRLRALGATDALDRDGNGNSKSNSVAGTDGSTGAPHEFDVVIDVVGGEALPSFFDRLAPNGRFVSVGIVAGYPPADFGMPLMRGFQRSLSFATFSLNTVPIAERNRVRSEQFEAAARGELVAVVHDVLPLAQAADAHRRMDAGEVFGRIVLTP
ncbi:zinc-binding dehydrogenase [Subtercola sp. RTI3]|uniref:zinc-binding dehydrogenase n=1 Tax=Subtercola sp. RTI3 TaxID=3048639 RepID=UPI002B2348A0|nr:zinc-binding dehydrogenase [Subtercola sp. RTI3]MEA9986579.1 zinc-binding dehydrogenase [Subtercola sp. RTI3]